MDEVLLSSLNQYGVSILLIWIVTLYLLSQAWKFHIHPGRLASEGQQLKSLVEMEAEGHEHEIARLQFALEQKDKVLAHVLKSHQREVFEMEENHTSALRTQKMTFEKFKLCSQKLEAQYHATHFHTAADPASPSICDCIRRLQTSQGRERNLQQTVHELRMRNSKLEKRAALAQEAFSRDPLHTLLGNVISENEHLQRSIHALTNELSSPMGFGLNTKGLPGVDEELEFASLSVTKALESESKQLQDEVEAKASAYPFSPQRAEATNHEIMAAKPLAVRHKNVSILEGLVQPSVTLDSNSTGSHSRRESLQPQHRVSSKPGGMDSLSTYESKIHGGDDNASKTLPVRNIARQLRLVAIKRKRSQENISLQSNATARLSYPKFVSSLSTTEDLQTEEIMREVLYTKKQKREKRVFLAASQSTATTRISKTLLGPQARRLVKRRKSISSGLSSNLELSTPRKRARLTQPLENGSHNAAPNFHLPVLDSGRQEASTTHAQLEAETLSMPCSSVPHIFPSNSQFNFGFGSVNSDAQIISSPVVFNNSCIPILNDKPLGSTNAIELGASILDSSSDSVLYPNGHQTAYQSLVTNTCDASQAANSDSDVSMTEIEPLRSSPPLQDILEIRDADMSANESSNVLLTQVRDSMTPIEGLVLPTQNDAFGNMPIYKQPLLVQNHPAHPNQGFEHMLIGDQCNIDANPTQDTRITYTESTFSTLSAPHDYQPVPFNLPSINSVLLHPIPAPTNGWQAYMPSNSYSSSYSGSSGIYINATGTGDDLSRTNVAQTYEQVLD